MYIFDRKTISAVLAFVFTAVALLGCAVNSSARGAYDFGEEELALESSYVYRGSFAPQGDFASSLNMLRVIKNRYYNAVDGALGEDRNISYLLYRFFDYVYGDVVLDLFSGCFGDEAEFVDSLAALGYTDCYVVRKSDCELLVCGCFFGTPRTLTAFYDPEMDAARLCVYEADDLVTMMEWRATEEGYALQYMRSISAEEFDALYGEPAVNEEDEDLGDEYVGQEPVPEPHLNIDPTPAPNEPTEEPTEEPTPEPTEEPTPEPTEEPTPAATEAPIVPKAEGDSVPDPEAYGSKADLLLAAAQNNELARYIGYRAYIRDDGTGVVCSGPFCSLHFSSILGSRSFGVGMVYANMFRFTGYTLTDKLITVRTGQENLAHAFGSDAE